MAYEKIGFSNGQVLKAEDLNHIEEGIANVSIQTDWNQNDENAIDYIKNKPFNYSIEETVLVSSSTHEADQYGSPPISIPENLQVGETYLIIFEGVEYRCVARKMDDSTILIGNGKIVDYEESDNNEPFVLTYYGGSEVYLHVSELGEYTLSISKIV